MPPWELVTGGAAAVVILLWITKVLSDRYFASVDARIAEKDARIADKDEIIARLISERDLALTGWRDQTSLTNAAVAAFAAERKDRNSRSRRGDGT